MIFVKKLSITNSIGRIRKYLPPDPLKRLVNVLVISHLDYCNSLLYGLPSYELAKLQRVQNTAARQMVGARRSDHMTPIFSTGCLYLLDWNLRSCFLRLSVSTIKVRLTSASYSSFGILHEHFAPPCNPYFRTRTALIPSTMVRGRLPSLLLNCGTLYLSILSQPRLCQLLKRHLKLTFFVATSLMANDAFVA